MRALLCRSSLVALALSALALSACGQRGPLFLPDEAPTEVKQNPPPATPAPETTPAPTPEPAETPAPEEGKDTERKPDEKPR
jgi:predicted small lipoprotein YifL